MPDALLLAGPSPGQARREVRLVNRKASPSPREGAGPGQASDYTSRAGLHAISSCCEIVNDADHLPGR